jgi:hypothetical protein
MALVVSDAVVKCQMENNYAETRAQLRANDPSVTDIFIDLFAGLDNITNAATILSEDLKANNFVSFVCLRISAKWTRVEQWKPLFRVLRSGQGGGALETITMIDYLGLIGEDDDPERLTATASSILQEVQGVPSLKILVLVVPVSSNALASFLEAANPNFAMLGLFSPHVGLSDVPALATTAERRHRVKPFALSLPCSNFSLELLQSFSAKVATNLCISPGESYFENDDCLLKMLGAIAKIKSIDMITFKAGKSQSFVHQLTHGLPAIKTKLFVLTMDGTREWTSVLDTKRNLMTALESNFAFLTVNISVEDWADFLDDGMKGKIAAYTERNVRLHTWVQHPQLVPPHLWPEALHLALRSGNDQLFQSLLSIASEL